MQCVCGVANVHAVTVRKGVVVSPSGEEEERELRVAECVSCGLVRQIGLPFATKDDWTDYYRGYPPTSSDYTKKSYAHDREVARARLANYGKVEGRVLDVGSGSGAFVDVSREAGAEAFGCEIAKYADAGPADAAFVYRACLEDIHFPTDFFALVTCHDVLEHSLDPAMLLREMFRITAQDGTCVVEIPRFHHPLGEHHWKDGEHIWFFSEDQLGKLISDVGFTVQSIDHPIGSKVSIQAIKPKQARTRILVPPGIGDSYWSIVKIPALLAREGIKPPVDIVIACPEDWEFQGHLRAFPFVQMFPFLKATGETVSGQHQNRPIWLEAYMEKGRTIFRDVLGCDYFVAYNGHLRHGESMELVDPDLQCDWFPPRFVSLEEERFRQDCVSRFGRYIVLYFVFRGTYGHWTNEFPAASVIDYARRVQDATGCVPVFAGALWDERSDDILTHVRRSVPGAIDMVGKTTVEQMFGMLRGAQGVVGYPSGLTIASTMLKTKTLIIWNHYYHPAFWWEGFPPSTRQTTYLITDTKGLTPDALEAQTASLVPHDAPVQLT